MFFQNRIFSGFSIYIMQSKWIIITLFFTVTSSADIELLECEPPDEPRWGGYRPLRDFYVPGDTIHYYCEPETLIGGNIVRKCEDTGDWTGDTPVCDSPSAFSSTSQSSTADDKGRSEKAVDGLRNTCTSTKGGQTDEWYGNFTTPGQLIGVMLFLPKVPVSYVVILVKPNGEEVICGILAMTVDRYDWHYQNCSGPNNRGASGVKIRSLNKSPLQICEIAAYVLTSPTCVDPHYPIESGRLRLDRKSADLMCNPGYSKSPHTALQCARDGVWNRKTLYCFERPWELGEGNPESPEQGRLSYSQPKRPNPGRERLEVPKRQNPERERPEVPKRPNPERERLEVPKRPNPTPERLEVPRRPNPTPERLEVPKRPNSERVDWKFE